MKRSTKPNLRLISAVQRPEPKPWMIGGYAGPEAIFARQQNLTKDMAWEDPLDMRSWLQVAGTWILYATVALLALVAVIYFL